MVKGIYRMHIAEASTDRVVIDVENISTMHYLFILMGALYR
jgi:hypothetical protein